MDNNTILAISHLKQAIDLLTPVPPIVETPVTYFANAWSKPGVSLKHVNWMARFGDQAYWGWAVPPAQTLEQCIAALAAMPKGQRWLQSWDYQRPDYGQGDVGFYYNPNDHIKDAQGNSLPGKTPFTDNAEKLVYAKFDAFFKSLKDKGVELDGLFMDFEDGYSIWGVLQADAMNAAQDPRFLPTLKKVGQTDMNVIYDFRAGPTYLRYNAVMNTQRDAMLNRAVYAALTKYYPKALCFNDGSCYQTADNWVPDLNGHHGYTRITDSKEDLGVAYGTHDCWECYGGGYNPGLAIQTFDGEVMGNSRRKAFIRGMNEWRAFMRSSSRGLVPILCPKYGWVAPGTSSETAANPTSLGCDLWEESIYHQAASGCASFIYWNPTDMAYPGMSFDDQNALVDKAMGECQANVPHLGQRLDVSAIPYTSMQVRSTLKCKGYSISRVTTFDKNGDFKGEWIKI